MARVKRKSYGFTTNLQNIVTWIKNAMPSTDEVVFAGMASISEDRGAGETLTWDSPFIATTYGLGFILAGKYDQTIVFWPWTSINKVSKTSGSLQNGVQVKKKRSLLSGFIFILTRASDEEKSEFKERKKEFKQTLPQLHKTANRSNLMAEEQSIQNSELKNASAFQFQTPTAPAAATCPSCDNPRIAGNAFCNKCGHKF